MNRFSVVVFVTVSGVNSYGPDLQDECGPCAKDEQAGDQEQVEALHDSVELDGSAGISAEEFEISHAFGDAAMAPTSGGDGNVVDGGDALEGGTKNRCAVEADVIGGPYAGGSRGGAILRARWPEVGTV